MLWTNNGYNNSVIFSLLAKSKALSNGILAMLMAIVSYYGSNSKLTKLP